MNYDPSKLEQIIEHTITLQSSHKRVDRLEAKRLKKFIAEKMTHYSIFIETFAKWCMKEGKINAMDDFRQEIVNYLAFLLNEIGLEIDLVSYSEYVYNSNYLDKGISPDEKTIAMHKKILEGLEIYLPLLKESFFKIKDDKEKIKSFIKMRSLLIGNHRFI